MFPGSYVPRDLCSPGPMFPRSYVSWLMNMLTPIGISVGVKLPNAILWYQIP